MSYSHFERHLSVLLESTPRLKYLAKLAYQRVNYAFARRKEAVSLNPLVSLEAVGGASDVLGTDSSRAECFFGYFGVSPWSMDGRYYLAHHWRAERPELLRIVVWDLWTGTSKILGESRAWSFQQGAMAQWVRTEGREAVIYNDCVQGRLMARIIELSEAETRYPWPLQALHPQGQVALSINYRRLAAAGSEYGYDVDVENFSGDQAENEDGIWRVDLSSGVVNLVVSIQALIEREPRREMRDAVHTVNHAIFSPSGERFVFMHRWHGKTGRFSRLYCVRSDGSDLQLLLDNRMISHYAWRDENTLLAWARAANEVDGYYLLDVDDPQPQPLGQNVLNHFGDGHPSFSPDRRFIVTDTYPDRARMRHLLLFDTWEERVMAVGSFFSPWSYDGARRCDLHPRWSPDGQYISIDSAHEGLRQSYIVDVRRLLS